VAASTAERARRAGWRRGAAPGETRPTPLRGRKDVFPVVLSPTPPAATADASRPTARRDRASGHPGGPGAGWVCRRASRADLAFGERGGVSPLLKPRRATCAVEQKQGAYAPRLARKYTEVSPAKRKARPWRRSCYIPSGLVGANPDVLLRMQWPAPAALGVIPLVFRDRSPPPIARRLRLYGVRGAPRMVWNLLSTDGQNGREVCLSTTPTNGPPVVSLRACRPCG